MTYYPRSPTIPRFGFQRRGPLRPIGVSGDDFSEAQFIEIWSAFLPKINEIQSSSDNAAQAEVDVIINKATGGEAKADAPIMTTVSGGAVGAGDFLLAGGVCKPRNKPALDAAKMLQLQLNRLARAGGLSTITVDGAIGPNTIKLLNTGTHASISACTQITAQLSALITAVTQAADRISAPGISQQDLADAARAGVITVGATNGKTFAFKPPGVQAGLLDTVKNWPDTTKIVLGGAALLGGVFLFKKFRGSRGGSAPAPAAAPTSNPRRRRRRRR